jgi:DNA-binding Lrp family transcriptional regulator
MNNKPLSEDEEYRTLQILNELSDNGSMSQRALSSRVGIALGLVNSYIKNMVAKGYVKVTSIPPRKYAYLLTPRGFAEKTRLTYHLLHDYTRIYREARANLKKVFGELQGAGVKKVFFAGADEIAEIAYISLQETTLELAGVVEDGQDREKFFGREINPVSCIAQMDYDCILVTTYFRRERIYEELVLNGAEQGKIRLIFPKEAG